MRAGTSRDYKASEQMSQQTSQEEHALRATLRAYAAGEVDTQVGWEAVAPRLTLAGAGNTARGWRRGPLAGVSRGVLVAAAVVALVVALAGAGVGAAYWGGLFGGPKAQLIGDKQLYTEIGQRQAIDGVTVSIDQAYADPGNIYLAISFVMPHDLGSQYSQVIVNRVTIAGDAGNEVQGLIMTCEPFWHDLIFHRDSVQHCMMNAGPLQPTTGTTTLNLSVEIGEVWLFRTADHERDILTGPWHFTFSLPFHQQSLGPGGPYAEPATRTPDANPATKTP
jgi:Domain of unknown function (DUF4179)